MKKLAMLLVLVLIFSCAYAQPALISHPGDVEWVEHTNLMVVPGQKGFVLTDINGNWITEDIYSSHFTYDKGLITAALYNGESLSASGALKIDGSVAVPFQYGDVDVLNENWAVGVALVEATRENYDYESWSSDAVYLIDYVDIYNVNTGAKITLPRANYADSNANGAILKVEDRLNGEVTVYDAAFNVLGKTDSLYNEDFVDGVVAYREERLYGLKDGEEIILEPTYHYIYGFRGDYAMAEMNGKYGLIDKAGNLAVPCEYDDFNTSYYLPQNATGYCAGGYFCIIQDGKLGYASAAGITCEPKYSEDIMENNGASATFTDMEGNLNIMAADGVITPVTGYERVRVAYDSSGFYYVVTDADYNYGLIDWHGEVIFPCQYNSIELSGDGQYALVEVDYNDAELYKLDNGEAAAAAVEVPAEAPAAEAPIAEAPAADNSAVKTLLESAKLVIATDANAAATIIGSAISMLNGNPAAAILEGAKAVLQTGSPETAITLIDNAINMLG